MEFTYTKVDDDRVLIKGVHESGYKARAEIGKIFDWWNCLINVGDDRTMTEVPTASGDLTHPTLRDAASHARSVMSKKASEYAYLVNQSELREKERERTLDEISDFLSDPERKVEKKESLAW